MTHQYTLEVAAVTDKGKKKTQNEDSILANTGENRWGRFGIFVVADGVGSSDCGREASLFAMERINTWWDNNLPVLLSNGKSIDEITTDLKVETELINLKILEKSRDIGKSMATTFSALIMINDQGRILHIGDSRIYRIRKHHIRQLSEDHTWVSDQIKKGLISESDALTHRNRHAITRCLGVKESCEFYQDHTDVRDGDLFLLCSDGFYYYYAGQEILQKLDQHGGEDYKELLNDMVDDIYRQGAHDNISAILVYAKKEKKGFMRWFK